MFTQEVDILAESIRFKGVSQESGRGTRHMFIENIENVHLQISAILNGDALSAEVYKKSTCETAHRNICGTVPNQALSGRVLVQ